MADPAGDPFPLLHLADLDFALEPASLASLAAFQLALAPWSTNWEDSMETSLKRTWRRRRERARAQITAKEPMGIYAADEHRNREQFPRFELIDLAFDLGAGESALEHLTSAQLAAVQFHPAATKDLVMAAEDIFFTRRERDFAAGFSLPPFSPSSSAPTAAPTPAPAPAPAPAPTPAPAPAVPAASTSRLPASAAPPPLATVPPAASPARSIDTGNWDDSPLPFRLPGLTVSPNPAPVQAQGASRLPVLAKPPPPPPSAPTSAFPPVVSQRDPEARRASAPDKGKQPERAHEHERERERDRSPGTAQRDKERAEYRAAKADAERKRAEYEDRLREEARRSCHRSREGERAEKRRDRSRDRSRDRNPERDRVDDRDRPSRRRSRSPTPTRDYSHRDSRDDAVGSTAAPSNKRAASPARSEHSLRDSVRRRVDDRPPLAAFRPSGPRNQTPPPVMPPPTEAVPHAVQSSLFTVFLRHFPGRLAPEDIDTFVRGCRTNTQLEPVAIKCHSKPNQDYGRPGIGAKGAHDSVTLAFVMFEDRTMARDLIAAADQSVFRGRQIIASQGAEQARSSWKWGDFSPAFVERYHQREFALYASRHTVPPGMVRGGLPPAPIHIPAFAPAAQAAPRMTSTTSVAGSTASGGGGSSSPSVPLPPHLNDALATLYVSNIAEHATLRDCHDFFDSCDGIVGLAMSDVEHLRDLRLRHVWLGFESHAERENAKHRLFSGHYPGAKMKLWVEESESRWRKTGEKHDWLWNEMSTAYRSAHAADYAVTRGVPPHLQHSQSQSPSQSQDAPPTPTLTPTHDPRRRPSHAEPPRAPPGSSRLARANPPPPLALGQPQWQPQPLWHAQAHAHAQEEYSPLAPALIFPLQPPPAPPPALQQLPTPAEASSSPGAGASPGWQDAPPPPRSAGVGVGVCGGGTRGAMKINPARLALLGGAGGALPVATTSPGPITTGGRRGDAVDEQEDDEEEDDERPTAAGERAQVEATTRSAWGARVRPPPVGSGEQPSEGAGAGAKADGQVEVEVEAARSRATSSGTEGVAANGADGAPPPPPGPPMGVRVEEATVTPSALQALEAALKLQIQRQAANYSA